MKRNLYFWTSIFFLVTAVVTAFLGIQKIQRISENEAEGSPAMIVCSILLMFSLTVFYFVLSIKATKRKKENMKVYVGIYNFLMDKIKTNDAVSEFELCAFGYRTLDIITQGYPKEFQSNAEHMMDEVFMEAARQKGKRSKMDNFV